MRFNNTVTAPLSLMLALLLSVSCGRMNASKAGFDSLSSSEALLLPPSPVSTDEEPITPSLVTPYQTLTPENEIWVAPYGDDANVGTLYEPKETIMAALRLATPGTAVMVKAGKYEEYVDFSGKSGAANRPIWIRSADGRGAAEIAPLDLTGPGIAIKGSRSLVIEGLKIKGGIHVLPDSAGLKATMVILKNNLVWQCFTSGVHAKQVSYLYLMSNDVSNCSQGEGLDLEGLFASAVVDNFVHDLHNSPTLNNGIKIHTAQSVHISNNIVEHVDGYALVLDGKDHTVKANSFKGLKGTTQIGPCENCFFDQSY